jgi:hypothetical protein
MFGGDGLTLHVVICGSMGSGFLWLGYPLE